jgi:hypothetical protein
VGNVFKKMIAVAFALPEMPAMLHGSFRSLRIEIVQQSEYDYLP